MRSKPYWKRWKKSLAQSCADGGREKIDMRYCLAIDIGASSGRHIVGWQEDGELRTQEVYRFPNGAKESDGRLIWDMESIGDIATVTVHIKKIREKIEFNTAKPQYIETIWGVGYRFKM